jgi:riboflavin biosynthesis pyrimidine reductase
MRAGWARRFEAFVARKERQAREARIGGLQTLEDHASEFTLNAVGTPWTRACFDGPFYWSARTDGRSVNLVFVRSREGNTVAVNPSALGGGETDEHLIYEGLSRVHADAVLSGAGTVARTSIIFSTWHPELVGLRESRGKPRHPVQVVISGGRSLTIDRELIFNAPEVPCMLVTSDGGAASYADRLRERPWVRVLTTGPRLDMRLALDAVARNHGLRVISCIGGRATAGPLLEAGLVQDLYLTTSPLTGGTPNTPLPVDVTGWRPVLRKSGRGCDLGVQFDHFQLTT